MTNKFYSNIIFLSGWIRSKNVARWQQQFLMIQWAGIVSVITKWNKLFPWQVVPPIIYSWRFGSRKQVKDMALGHWRERGEWGWESVSAMIETKLNSIQELKPSNLEIPILVIKSKQIHPPVLSSTTVGPLLVAINLWGNTSFSNVF